MSRFIRHTGLGFRWVKCGWRLFQRNPWLLFGMGGCGALLIALFAVLPFIGTPLIALLIPVLLAGFYLALDHTAQQRLRLPATRRLTVLKQSPRALLVVFRDEGRSMQIVVLSFYCMAAVVLADILLYSVAGSVWANRTDLQALPRLIVLLSAMFVIYTIIAASIIYTLPLAFFEKTPLVPAMQRSITAAARHAAAFIAPALLLLLPIAASVLLSSFSEMAAYLVGVVGGALTIAVLAATLYCSYRNLFPQPDAAREVRRVSKNHRARAA